jgi:hypothetical protein
MNIHGDSWNIHTVLEFVSFLISFLLGREKEKSVCDDFFWEVCMNHSDFDWWPFIGCHVYA